MRIIGGAISGFMGLGWKRKVAVLIGLAILFFKVIPYMFNSITTAAMEGLEAVFTPVKMFFGSLSGIAFMIFIAVGILLVGRQMLDR